MSEDKIIAKLSEHDKILEKIDKRFEQVDKRLEKHDVYFDKIFAKLVEHDQRFEEMATKVELNALRYEIMHSQDQMMVILNRLDQERFFSFDRLKQVESRVDIHDVDIKNIKLHLNQV